MTLLALFGGLALLLYGMQLTGEGLQRTAGGHLRHLAHEHDPQPAHRGGLGGAGHRADPVLVGDHADAHRVRVGGARVVPPVAGRHPRRRHSGRPSPCRSSRSKTRTSPLLLVGIGFAPTFFARRGLAKNLGQAVLGFGFLFLGMRVMTEGLAQLTEHLAHPAGC